ncbi:WD repeat domain 27 [Pitangus sulphuratus]|nr:WD repeat domain 27 [Pitangus sulphuratus]
MESAGARCSAGGSCDPEVVCEKHLFKAKLPEPLAQLACSHHHCAFPVNGNELCIWNTATAQVWDYSTSQLMYQSGIITGEGQNNSKVCKTDNMRPEGSVETSLPILLIEHCDFLVCFHNEENTYSSLNTSYFWIGTSTGLLIINLANFELEAFLSYKDYSDLSIRFARSCALTKKTVNGKVLCLITSMFEDRIAVLEINLAALARTQHSVFLPCGNENSLSVIARCSLLTNSPLRKGLKKNRQEPSSKTLGVKNTVKDKPLVFHNKIKSSGYTAAPRKNKEYPLDGDPPIKYEKEISVTCKPTPIFCVQYSGDGEMLACGLADKTVLVFNSNLTDTYNVFSGHDGAVNSVGWSHNKKWLVSSSEDRTLRVWSVCNKEPALVMGKENFDKTVRFAQFYFLDTFILLCCGAEFHLLNFHPDTTKDDLKRSLYLMTWTSVKGSSFSTQQPEAYNLFMTTAAGDGIKLWDIRTLRCERRFEGHSSRCYPCGIAVSPCGRFIASGSDDKYAYIYEMRSSTFLHKLGRHTESVSNVTFSPSTPRGTTQLCVISKLAEGALNPTDNPNNIPIDKDIREHQSQDGTLRDTTHHWPLPRHRAIDHNSVAVPIQLIRYPVINPPFKPIYLQVGDKDAMWDCVEENQEFTTQFVTMETGEVPEDWKEANVTVFKKGKTYDPVNYCPGNLASIPGKVMKCLILEAIFLHMDNKNVIKSSQHGFTKGKSCLTKLMVFYDETNYWMDEGRAVGYCLPRLQQGI